MNKLEEIVKIAGDYFPEFLEANKDKLGGRTGLALEVLSKTTHTSRGVILGHFGASELERDKKSEANKQLNVARKIWSLITYDWFTSFPTQDYSKGMYGGGVAGSNVYLAVSGFPPELDHAFVCEVLKRAGEIMSGREERIRAEFELYKNHGISDAA
ncbi:hypothetical protein KA013_02485 [Patescibacteria group bacterium]|nr:hypothetical protein [Patescibacteria group bacterium]